MVYAWPSSASAGPLLPVQPSSVSAKGSLLLPRTLHFLLTELSCLSQPKCTLKQLISVYSPVQWENGRPPNNPEFPTLTIMLTKYGPASFCVKYIGLIFVQRSHAKKARIFILLKLYATKYSISRRKRYK